MKDIFIVTAQQYEEAAKRLEALKNTPEQNDAAKEIKVLTKGMLDYERRHRPTSNNNFNRL